jgi:hypothetical protein
MSAVKGDRVRLIFTDDPHTHLKPGDVGTVWHTDSTGTVMVDWDSGSSLGMIEGEDQFEILLCAVCGEKGHTTAEHSSPLDAIPDVDEHDPVAWVRDEDEPCERGTVGCSVAHGRDDSDCEGW